MPVSPAAGWVHEPELSAPAGYREGNLAYRFCSQWCYIPASALCTPKTSRQPLANYLRDLCPTTPAPAHLLFRLSAPSTPPRLLTETLHRTSYITSGWAGFGRHGGGKSCTPLLGARNSRGDLQFVLHAPRSLQQGTAVRASKQGDCLVGVGTNTWADRVAGVFGWVVGLWR